MVKRPSKQAHDQPVFDSHSSEMNIDSSATAGQHLAKHANLSLQELIRRDLTAMRDEGARPLECLHVADIEDFAHGVPFSEEMQAHVAQCANCTTLLELSKPSPEHEEAFLQAVRDADGVLRMMGNVGAKR